MQKEGKKRVLYEEKSRVCTQILRAYAGITDAETQSPRGCCGNPGICPKCAQGQKRLKGLSRATHCTDRARASGNVSPTVESCPPHPTFGTKVRARRDVPEGKKKITIIHMHFFRVVFAKIADGKQQATAESKTLQVGQCACACYILSLRRRVAFLVIAYVTCYCPLAPSFSIRAASHATRSPSRFLTVPKLEFEW